MNTSEAHINPDKTGPESKTRDEAIKQLTEFITSNRVWMLTTAGSDHIIRSRPMLNVNKHFEGDLYLLVDKQDSVFRAINENPQVNLTISEPSNGRFASIVGKAKAMENDKKVELIWDQACEDWFETDKPGHNLKLVRVDVTSVDYWDATPSLMQRVSNFFRLWRDTVPAESDVDRQKVTWSHTSNPPDDHSVSASLLHHHGSSQI